MGKYGYITQLVRCMYACTQEADRSNFQLNYTSNPAAPYRLYMVRGPHVCMAEEK